MEFEELLKKLANSLKRLGINYCITGGYAVSVWGKPRATFDIDVIIQLEEKNVDSLIKNLHPLSKAGYIEESLAKEKVEKGGEFNFIHSESGIKIDFWVIKENDDVGMAELKRKIGKDFDGQKIYFISPEDLILSKLRWFEKSQSTRHLDDAKSVIKISGDKIDMSYLNKEAGKQGVKNTLDNLLKI